MTFLKLTSFIVVLFVASISFAQDEQINDDTRIDQTISYSLQDFNDKYYTLFKESYTSFKNLKGKDAIIVDFENGEKETVLTENDLTSFSVDFYTAMEKAVSIKLLEDIVNRIMISSPKGFEIKQVSNTEAFENKATLIVYNIEHASKSAHQPTILVWMDKNDFTVKMKIIEPVLK